MILKIKSKYMLLHIYNFIENKQFALKLFFHSKYFQKKLDINYSYCYEKYLDELNLNLKDFLHIYETKYEKDILRKKYNEYLRKNILNKDKFEKIIYEVINNKNEKDEEKYINIDSPLLEILSKTKVFDKIFTIFISQKNIDEYKLKDDYITIFNKLNNSNIKYTSIYYIFNEITKIDYLKELNTNFNDISKLEIKYNGSEITNNEYSNNSTNIINFHGTYYFHIFVKETWLCVQKQEEAS